MARTVPTLVFLHGIGSPRATNSAGWQEALQTSWAAQQLPWDLANVATLEPRYIDLFQGSPDEDVDSPPATEGGPDAKSSKVQFEVRKQSLIRLVGDNDPFHDRRSRKGFIPDPVVSTAVTVGRPVGFLGMPDRYRNSPAMRHRVLRRILEQLEGTSDIVVIAHSLGSVVALDLLSRLPAQIHVDRLVTIGSPLGREAVTRQWNERLRRSTFPHHRVGSWLNVWSPHDYVCGGRPVEHPAVVNFRADVPEHSHRYYLAQPTASLAIGEALFGNPSRAIELSARGVSRAFVPGEAQLLRLVQAGRVMRDVIDSGKDRALAERFGAALLIREERFFDLYRTAGTAEQRDPHPDLALAIADPNHIPAERAEENPDIWIDVLVMLLHFDFTEPVDIDTERFHEDFAAWMARRFTMRPVDGIVVFKAAEETRSALKPRPWGRYIAAAAGVAMLAAATGGLGLAVAAPALTGAAALTSGLAAFGPGGMIGGLMTAGGLASAGSASLVASMLNGGGANAEEAILQLTSQALARKRLDKSIANSPELLVLELRAALVSRLETNRTLSDKGSKSVKRDEDLLEFCDRALDFIEEHDLNEPVSVQTG